MTKPKRTPWLAITIAIILAAYAATLTIHRTTPPSRTDSTHVVPRTEAKPNHTNNTTPADGCETAPTKDLNYLLQSLKPHEQGTAELSTQWTGNTNTGHTTAIALMVRTTQGAINHPQLVWIKHKNSWQAATPATATASTLKANPNLATSQAVANATHCLNNPHH